MLVSIEFLLEKLVAESIEGREYSVKDSASWSAVPRDITE
jgi:hypothetical protein